MTTSDRLRRAALILCISTSGCSILTPLPDHFRYFNLAPMSSAPGEQQMQRAPSAGSAEPVYGLGPIQFPAYLDRNELVTRVSPTEIAYSTTERWSEPLAGTFSSVLLQDLSNLLDTHSILPYPGAGLERMDYQIGINVLQFDNDAAGNVRLIARWRVTDLRTAMELVAKETNVAHPQSAGDANTRVAALSDAVHALAQDVAGALRQLPARSTTPATVSHRK